MRGQLEGMSVVVAAAVMGLFWGDLSRTLSRTPEYAGCTCIREEFLP